VIAQTANTALCYAAMHGHTEVLRFLLAQGANVNAENRDGATALMRAALANEVNSARILLENGASVKCRDKYGRTALMYAAMNGSYESAQLLLQHKAAKSERDHVCVILLLLDAGIFVMFPGLQGAMTAFDWAVHRSRDRLIPLLVCSRGHVF
jgi:ankyrin repeat protein